jgi:alpha-methylacyl-CoA racemase
MDGSLALLAQAFSTFFANHKVPRRGESINDGGIPNYNVYLTKDEKYITIAAIEPWFFANLCRALGREDFIPHEYDSGKRAEIARVFTETFRTKTRDEWFEILSKSDICVGRMLTLDEVADDPQVQARNMIVEVEAPSGKKVRQVGISAKFSGTPGSIRSLAPQLGQHTEEILGELGYGKEDVERWREAGAIK